MTGGLLTAVALDRLPSGWTTVHAPAGPGGASLADHVVVGPPGVFVVVTARTRHAWDRAVTAHGTRRAAAAAASVAAMMPFVPRHHMHAVLCLAGPGPARVSPGCADVAPRADVLVLGEADLAHVMLTRPAILPVDHALALGAALRAEVAPVRGSSWPGVELPVAATAARRTPAGSRSARRRSVRVGQGRTGAVVVVRSQAPAT